MKITGYRYEPTECRVYISDADGQNLRNLPMYLNEVNHSPTGFEWGYGGSGPAQLAYAILRWYSSHIFAQRHYQQFKWDVVAMFPREGFVLEDEEIKKWCDYYCL
jgi:hypothetical protein